MLAITNPDAFKARAYEKAARSIGGYHEDVAGADLKRLTGIPNVGRSIVVLEALIGQIFLVTLVARLVSLMASRGPGRNEGN